MNKYLLVYGNNLGTREQIVDVLNAMSEVRNWRYDMPNSFYIYSETPQKELIDKIRMLRGNNGRCILVKMDDYSGWLPDKTWTFLNRED